MAKVINTTVRKRRVTVIVGGGDTSEVAEDQLRFDTHDRALKATDAAAVDAIVMESSKPTEEAVTAAVLGQAVEAAHRHVDAIAVTIDSANAGKRATDAVGAVVLSTEQAHRAGDVVNVQAVVAEQAKKAVEDISNVVSAVTTEAGDRASELTSAAIVLAEAGRKATDAETAFIVPTGDLGKHATETALGAILAIVAETGKRALETITAVISTVAEAGKRAAEVFTAIATYAGYANANVSTTGWVNPGNALGNTTGTSSTLTATSSGLAGTTSNTTTGTIVLGFADPLVADLPIASDVTINVETSMVSSGTLPLGQSGSLQIEYSLNGGGAWTSVQTRTATSPSNLAKAISTATIATGSITYSQLNALQVRVVGSVTSGTGLSAQTQANVFRAWVAFTASKAY